MPASSNFRFLLAAIALLLLFTAAYEAAVRWPGQPIRADVRTGGAASADSAAVGGPAAKPPAATLASAATAPSAAAEPEETALPCPTVPLRFKVLPTSPVFCHYVGTVGGVPASAELSWTRPDSAAGSCYLWQGGLEYQLETPRRRRGLLVLALSQEQADTSYPRGIWRLATPLGPVLRGTWIDSAGRSRPFMLREDYRQSVPYNIQRLKLSGGKPPLPNCYGSSLTRGYLHLLGHLRPAWQRLQASSFVARKRHLPATYERDGDTSYYFSVRLNDFNLLSYQSFYVAFPSGGPRQDGFENGLLDLATGRSLPLASQLQPGYEPTLRRLLTNRLRRNFGLAEASPGKTDNPKLLDLPSPDELHFIGLVPTGAGMEGSYLPGDICAVLGPEAKVYSIPYTLLIPYAELRPLVRPGTPLARMLRARRLW